MIHYTIDHFVTRDGDSSQLVNNTVHGDDSVAVWLVSDYQTDQPDLTIKQPPEGFTWVIDKSGYTKHPPELAPEDHLDKIKSITTDDELQAIKDDYLDGHIKRVSPWETVLTDGYTQP